MSVYTPATLREPTAITATSAVVFTASATGAIMRTYSFNGTTAHNVTLSIGTGGAADAVTNRLLDKFGITVNVPYLVNGWWVLQNTDTINVWSDSIATSAPVFGAWGYTYV